MTTGKTIVFLDIDGCLYDRGALGFLIDSAEKILNIKDRFLPHQQSTDHCLAVGSQRWVNAARSSLHTIRQNPQVRRIGKEIHKVAMNMVFQCAENSKLAEALSELSNNPDVGIVFLTNGPGGHARNTVRTVLTEEVLKSLFGFNYSDKNIILTKNLSHKKPDSRAFEDALQVTMTTMGISSEEEISKIFVVDDNHENLEGAKEAFGDKVDCIHITQGGDKEFLTCPNMVGAVNKIVSFCLPHQHASR
jgi:FMN phosphatase YigB (HAD superfamily)